MARLSKSFGRDSYVLRQNSPITDDQLMSIAPSIFAMDKHESRSDRYTYIPTIQVLNGLRKEGFLPFMAAQSRSRVEGKEDFTKHMLRLRRADQINGQDTNEIILLNSHDGTSSYQMLAGRFRFVCQNGMVCGDIVEDVRIPHRGEIVNNVVEAAYEILDEFDLVDNSVDQMKSTRLLLPEQAVFADAALSLKYEDPKEAPIKAEQILRAQRWEDRSGDNTNSLWGTFNRIQENLIRGGLHGRTTDGKRTTTREVRGIDSNIKLNKALWILADKMAELKS